MNDNDSSDGKIIQFPNRMKVHKNLKISDKAIKLHTDLKFAEHLTEGLVVNMIANMQENGMDTENPEFIKDIGFMIELVKACIYRDMGVKHPMQELVDIFVLSDYDETQGLYTEFDLDLVKDVIEEIKGDEKE
jgi:hypothetical protein|tara:strand:+ start:161 stop:559 length:399 start_codon:yes stop_codon:yes gene_type:complete